MQQQHSSEHHTLSLIPIPSAHTLTTHPSTSSSHLIPTSKPRRSSPKKKNNSPRTPLPHSIHAPPPYNPSPINHLQKKAQRTSPTRLQTSYTQNTIQQNSVPLAIQNRTLSNHTYINNNTPPPPPPIIEPVNNKRREKACARIAESQSVEMNKNSRIRSQKEKVKGI